jgi:hypothetical protein
MAAQPQGTVGQIRNPELGANGVVEYALQLDRAESLDLLS